MDDVKQKRKAKTLTFGKVGPKLRGIFQRLCKSQRWNLAILIAIRTCSIVFYRSKDLPLRICALHTTPDGGVMLKLDQHMIKPNILRRTASQLRKTWSAKEHRVDEEIKQQIHAWITQWADAHTT